MSGVWDEVMGAAITGTRRRPAPVADWLARAGVRPPAEVVDVLAVLAAGRQAAPTLGTGPRPPEPAGDTRPVISDDLFHRVGTDSFLLRELLTHAARYGLRPPAEVVPRLLIAARAGNLDQELVQQVTGPLGDWLAEQNPAWRTLASGAGTAEENLWLHPSPQVRAQWLGRLRRTDPTRARELVARALAPRPEKAEFKVMVLRLLADPEQEEDAALLEDALDARAESVRIQARRVLTHRLAATPYHQRMRDRAARWLRVQRTDRGLRVQHDLPEQLEPADLRDGLTTDRPTVLLETLLGLVPLATWAQYGTPEQVVQGLLAHHQTQPLAALVRRATLEKDPAWAQPLFAAGSGPAGWGGWLVPQEQADARIRQAVRALADGKPLGARQVVPTLTPGVVAHVIEFLPRMDPLLVGRLTQQIARMPEPDPAHASWLEQAQAGCPPQSTKAITDAVHLLRLRRWLLESCRETARRYVANAGWPAPDAPPPAAPPTA